MAGRGRAPQVRLSRERDERKRSSEMTKVAADGVIRGPELPEVPEHVWHPRTVAWWDTWRRSPMAVTWIQADWDFLLDTALLHSAMWHGEPKHAAEIRLRVGKFAGTPEDRLRLRLEVDEDAAKASRRVRNMDRQRRERLLSIVEG
jgi:hypothetical protein